MERLTFEGNFCDIAQCKEIPCPYNGACSQRKVWERLKAYEDTHMMSSDVTSMRMDMAIIAALFNGVDVDRMKELAEADKEGRLFLLPLEPGRSMLCQEHFERPWVMKNVAPCVQYQSSVGIVFYMEYDVFRGLVEHGKITPLSPEGEKSLEAMEDD